MKYIMNKLNFIFIALIFGYSFCAKAQTPPNVTFTGTGELTCAAVTTALASAGVGTRTGCPIPSSAFSPSFTAIVSGYTSIGEGAFHKCSGLKSITIPNSVTSIGVAAFEDCISLESITLPAGLKTIGNEAFYGCSGLKSITIPNSVTSIANYTFYGCSGLKSIILPAGLKSIESSAFKGCWALESITLPSGLQTIGSQAFNGCSGLKSITLPSGLKFIWEMAFYGCSGLKSITLPSGLQTIGLQAFYSCSDLKSITFKGKTPPTIAIEVFLYVPPSGVKIILPMGISESEVDAYVTALADKGLGDADAIRSLIEIPVRKPNTILYIGGKVKVGPNSKVIIGPP